MAVTEGGGALEEKKVRQMLRLKTNAENCWNICWHNCEYSVRDGKIPTKQGKFELKLSVFYVRYLYFHFFVGILPSQQLRAEPVKKHPIFTILLVMDVDIIIQSRISLPLKS